MLHVHNKYVNLRLLSGVFGIMSGFFGEDRLATLRGVSRFVRYW